MKNKKQKYLNNLYNFDSKKNEYEISLSIKNYEEIFNPYDYSQYKKRDIDEEFLDYIYENSKDIPLKHNIKLTFYLKKEGYDEEKSSNLKNALKNNFIWQNGVNTNNLKRKYRESILSFIAGFVFLTTAFVFIPQVGTGGFLRAFVESLSIIGWVFLWDLVETIVFEITELIKKRRYLKRLISSKVEFKTY